MFSSRQAGKTAAQTAALIQRATDAEVRASALEGVLIQLLEDLDTMPMSITITPGMRRRWPSGDVAVRVPRPSSLEVTLGKARALTGGWKA